VTCWNGGRSEAKEILLVKRWSKAVAMAASTLGLLGSGFFTSQAYAGTDGQQINLCGYPSSVTSARVSGTGPNGSIAGPVTKFFNPALTQCFEDLPGYWWKGEVKIEWIGSDNRSIKATTCNVPERQDGDWFNCNF
jgi:hypothetical protein